MNIQGNLRLDITAENKKVHYISPADINIDGTEQNMTSHVVMFYVFTTFQEERKKVEQTSERIQQFER